MHPKSVLLVSDFAFINGGQAKVAIDSARLLAEAGLQVTFFAAVGPVDSALDHPGIEVELLDQKDILSEPSRLRAMTRGIWNRTARERLEATVARFDPKTTVLHCHGYAKALSPSIGPVLTDGPLPTVYTMHEYFLACPNGGFYDYQRNEICTRRALGTACLTSNCDVRKPAHKVWRVARQMATWGPGGLPRGMRDIIYISETQKRAMAPYLPGEARLHHVPNPIARPDGPAVRAEENDIYLFVGRLNPEKGGRIFAEAARKAGVRAVFVGDGAEADVIRAVNPDAEILGWKSPAEVQEWLGKARALVFPSLWYEGQPLTPLEALARGVPVVCGTWSAAAECVTDGKTGILYDRPEVDSLAGALSRVEGMSFGDASEVLDPLEPAAHLQMLLDLYEELLARPSAV
jgi:glycosyltransferase involved in cell wall biosynthesis